MIMTRLSPEEYIVATIQLYLDIINLFIEILKILEKVNRKCGSWGNDAFD